MHSNQRMRSRFPCVIDVHVGSTNGREGGSAEAIEIGHFSLGELLQLHHRNSEFLPHLTHCESHSLAFPCKSQKDKLPLLDVNAFAMGIPLLGWPLVGGDVILILARGWDSLGRVGTESDEGHASVGAPVAFRTAEPVSRGRHRGTSVE